MTSGGACRSCDVVAFEKTAYKPFILKLEGQA